MKHNTGLILAFAMLAGCSTMHTGNEHPPQSSAPMASASAQATSAVTMPARGQDAKTAKKPGATSPAQDAVKPDSSRASDTGKSASTVAPEYSVSDTTDASDESVSSSPIATSKPVATVSAAAKEQTNQGPAPKVIAETPTKRSATRQRKAKQSARSNPPPVPKARAAKLAMTGSVQLTAGRGQTVSATDYANTVIYFVPDEQRARPKPGKFAVYTNHRDFSPSWLVVPLGSEVTFTNLDSVKHNVFSVTPGSSFDLGYQSADESITHTFTRAGLVLLSCHVHRAMRGDVLVVPSRYATTARSDGHFVIADAPQIAGTLYFWNPRTRGSSIKVQTPFASIQQKLVVSKPAVATKIGIGRQP